MADGKRKSEWVNRQDRKQKDLVVPVYPQDLELVLWLQQFLGCSKAEAVRTAIRSFAGQMKGIQRDVGRGP